MTTRIEEVKAAAERLNERIPSYSEALDDLALLRDFALAAIPVIEAAERLIAGQTTDMMAETGELYAALAKLRESE